MSLSHSPSIVTNGLAFYYDMSNTQKSWRGAPTTNLIATTPYVLTTYTACSGPIPTQSTNEFGQMSTVNRYTITGTGGVPRGRIIATGLTVGVNYSYSIKIRYNGAVGPQSWHLDSSKGNPEGGTNNNTFNSRTLTSTDIGNGWYKVVETFNFATCPTGKSMSNFGFSAPNASYLNQTFDVYDLQFEQSSFATPFVAGTRSNTQAISDLTGNNTATANSLTYASDGTFSFNGTTDYTTLSPNIFNATLPNFTISTWFNKNNNGILIGNHFHNSTWESVWFSTELFIVNGANNSTTNRQSLSFTAPSNSVWNNLVAVNSSSLGFMKVYLNGSEIATRAATVVPWNSSILPTIGTQRNVNTTLVAPINGQIPIVNVYNRALSAAEVQQNFNALRGRFGI